MSTEGSAELGGGGKGAGGEVVAPSVGTGPAPLPDLTGPGGVTADQLLESGGAPAFVGSGDPAMAATGGSISGPAPLPALTGPGGTTADQLIQSGGAPAFVGGGANPTISPTAPPPVTPSGPTSSAPGMPVGNTGSPLPGNATSSTPAPAPTGAPDNFATKALKTLGIYDPAKGTLGTNALPLATLAGSQLLNRGNDLSSQLKDASKMTSGPAQTLIDRGMSGEVNKSTAFNIDQWLNGQMAQINQRYAAMGRDPNVDSGAQKEIADAQAQAVAMRDAAANDTLQQGLAAAGLSQGPLTQAAVAGAQEDKELSNAMSNTMQQMMMLQMLQGRGGG